MKLLGLIILHGNLEMPNKPKEPVIQSSLSEKSVPRKQPANRKLK